VTLKQFKRMASCYDGSTMLKKVIKIIVIGSCLLKVANFNLHGLHLAPLWGWCMPV